MKDRIKYPAALEHRQLSRRVYEGVEEVFISLFTIQYQSSPFSNLPEAFDSFWKKLYSHIKKHISMYQL